MMKLLKKVTILLIALPLLYFISCVSEITCAAISYDKTVEEGLKNNKYIQEFNGLYPNSYNHISYFTGNEKLPPLWNSETIIYERYRLTMQMSIRHNMGGTITKSEDPKYYLTEIIDVEIMKDGRISYEEKGITHFSKKEWLNLFKNKGNYSNMGLELKKNQPIKSIKLLKKRYKKISDLKQDQVN